MQLARLGKAVYFLTGQQATGGSNVFGEPDRRGFLATLSIPYFFMTRQAVIVELAIPGKEFQRLYSGAASDVVAVSEAGETVRFPARILRGEVTHDGVHGRFEIAFDDAGRFLAITRL